MPAPRTEKPAQARSHAPRHLDKAPAAQMYTLLRHGRGLDHEEAATRLREALAAGDWHAR